MAKGTASCFLKGLENIPGSPPLALGVSHLGKLPEDGDSGPKEGLANYSNAPN